MPLDAPRAATAQGFAIDEANHTVRFERRLKSTPEQAFDAWTKPEQISRWWDPNGRPLAACDIDLRVGGQFLFTMDNHHPFGGVYDVVDRPRRLGFTAMGSKGLVLFTPVAGGTDMLVTITCENAEQLKGFLQVGVAEGTSATLDNLANFLGA